MYHFIPKEEKTFEDEDTNWWILSIVAMVILFIPVAFWLWRVLR